MNSFSKEIGLTNNVTIGKIIKEKRNPSYDVTLKIVTKYPQFSLNWLIKGTGDVYGYNSDERKSDSASDLTSPYSLPEHKIANIERKLLEVMMELKELKEQV